MSPPRIRRWPDPPPRYLEERAEVRVRFQEVDGLQVVWHGHYISYFEAGRDAFGRTFGLTYKDVMDQGYVVPLVHVAVDYVAPARFGDVLEVVARLHPEEAARVTFTYEVRRDGKTLASGRTVQAFTDLEGNLVLTRPAFYVEWLARFEDRLQGP